jgi:hypothetical protein
MLKILVALSTLLFFGCSDNKKEQIVQKEVDKAIQIDVNFKLDGLEQILKEISSGQIELKENKTSKISIDKNIDLSNFSFNEKMAWLYYGGGFESLQRDGFYTFLGIEKSKSREFKLDKNLGMRDILFLIDKSYFDSLPIKFQEMIRIAFAIYYDEEYFKIKNSILDREIITDNKEDSNRSNSYQKMAKEWSLLSTYSYLLSIKD